MLVEHVAGIGGRQHADDEAHEDGHQRIGDGADGNQNEADNEHRPKLVDEIADEWTKTHRRLAVGCERYGRIEIVEIGDDAVEHCELIL